MLCKLRNAAVNLFILLKALNEMDSVHELLAKYDGEQFQKLKEKTEGRFVIDWKLASYAFDSVVTIRKGFRNGKRMAREVG